MAPVLQGAIWHAPHDDRGAALSFTQPGRMGGCHGRADPIIATDVPADDRVTAIRLSMELCAVFLAVHVDHVSLLVRVGWHPAPNWPCKAVHVTGVGLVSECKR
jgi:hypothetical protein